MSIHSLLTLFLFGLPFSTAEKSTPAVVFDIRALSVPADVELIGAPAKANEMTFLNDAELKKLLETAQGLRRTNVMQAPRVTASHDEAVVVKAVETQLLHTTVEASIVKGGAVLMPKKMPIETGTILNLRGRVSADKTAVGVDVKYSEKRIEKVELIPVTTMITPVFEGGSQGQPVPFTQFLEAPHLTTIVIEKKDLRLASGEHVAIAGPSYQTEIREESRIPFLGDLPIAGRLFRTTGVSKAKMRTILIVSSRVMEE
jgi:hypothetical protein